MHDSRKTLLNVFFDNIINPLNIALIVLLVIFIMYQEYFYIIPIAISFVASVFQTIIDIKKYVYVAPVDQIVHISVDGKELETTLAKIKVGDQVVLYPNDVVNYVGVIKSGIVFVDEKSITGISNLVKKEPGMSIVKGSIIVEGSAIYEVTELIKRRAKKVPIQETGLINKIKALNAIISFLTLIALTVTSFVAKEEILNVTKASLVAIPFLLNVFLIVVNYVKDKKQKDGIHALDNSILSELQNIDVLCLDKTGTITSGEYDVFKTVVISKSSFSHIALDTNRGLEQAVANIIKTTKESGGYFKALQERFFYEPSKIIDDYSSLTMNGLYSAVTVHGGNTYAIGEVENFDLSNSEAASSSINEYQSLGYKVLLLVESKKPLKSGLIDGKSTAIALIVLQEKIRENVKNLISYCLHNGIEVKVLSGDKTSITTEACRLAGVDITSKVASMNLMPFEKVAMLVNGINVFTDASPSMKAFIVNELKKSGKKVLYIGDGDNDTQALKSANASIALSTGSLSAKRCAHMIIDSNFDNFESLNIQSKNHHGKMMNVLSIFYSQALFALIYLFVFLIANLIDKSIYNPFSYQHLWVYSLFGVVIPSSLILLEPNRDKYVSKGFFRNVIANTLLLCVTIGTIYVIQLMQYSGVGFYGIPSDLDVYHQQLITSKVANNLSYLALLGVSMVIFYNYFTQFNKYRITSLLGLSGVVVIYYALLAFNVDSLSPVTQIDTYNLTLGNYFSGLVIIAICSGVYLFILSLIDVFKGENIDVKSKS